jgi:prolyl oligopeptidase
MAKTTRWPKVLAAGQWLPDPECAGWAAPAATTREPLKALPAFFDADGMRVEQRFARSKDGTRVPYFVVWPKGSPRSDGRNPTLLYGYGGFEVSMQPGLPGSVAGRTWLARGVST